MLLCAVNCTAQNADIRWLRDINLNRPRNLEGSMITLTNSAYVVSAAAPITELLAGYARHDSALVGKGYTTIAGLGFNFIVAFGLKYAVNRTRPYVTYPYLQPYQHDSDPSFPSGHSSFAFNTATSLYLSFPKWYVAVPAYAWAAGVGYSRLYLGMHYPSDVLAGATVGIGTSWLAFQGNKWLHQHRKYSH